MYMLARDYAQALAAYRKVLELDPHNVQAKEKIDVLSAGAQ
jgi:cytochrome c-type biogenesis protein CcmH/NrfG